MIPVAWIRGVAPGIAIVCLAGGVSAARGATPQPLPFRPGYAPAVVVDAQVNGAGPFPFLVDTGSSHSVISSELAVRLGLPRVAKTRLSTSAGDDWTAVVRAGRISVGAIEATDVLATELPAGRLRLGAGLAGVIGLDLLGQRPFALDYGRQQIDWPDAWRADDGGVPLRADGLVWRIGATSGGVGVGLVLDSGAGAVVLFDRGQWASASYRSGTTQIETVVSRRDARNAVLGDLNIGGVRLVNQGVVVVDGADIDRAHGDGLLPLHLFDRITFWPREGVVRLDGDERRPPGPLRVQ